MVKIDNPIRRLASAVGDSKAPAISRAAAILRLLGRSETPRGLQSIARELGLVPSTCLYVLRALAAEELVAFDQDTKRYSLHAGILTLARDWLRRDRFNERVQPALRNLSDAFGVTALGVQVAGLDHITVVAATRAPGGLALSAEVGSRFPALISATGRCIAAHSQVERPDLERRFAALQWHSAPTFDGWLAEVEQARTQGFAIDAGNYIGGVTVLAAPVLLGRRVSHAVVAVGLSGSGISSRLELAGKTVRDAALALSSQDGSPTAG